MRDMKLYGGFIAYKSVDYSSKCKMPIKDMYRHGEKLLELISVSLRLLRNLE